MRFLIAVCVGVAATLAWQSYGDAARQNIANLHPQLSWLAPEAAVAQTAAAAIAPAIASLDRQELKTMARDLAALRQRIDQLAAAQERMARAQQEILGNISAPTPQPVAAQARKPVAPQAQPAPVR